jgi:hypothetical protein
MPEIEANTPNPRREPAQSLEMEFAVLNDAEVFWRDGSRNVAVAPSLCPRLEAIVGGRVQ